MDRNSRRAAGATHDSSGHQPAFDYERSLARLGGDPHLFNEIVVLFLEDSPQLMEQARCGLQDHDLPTLERAAHSLKGLSVNFDAASLASAAYSLEQGAHDGDLERAQEALTDMERELERLQADLSAFRDSERGDRHAQ
jgi:HPt (histidine-containing phosphotransfer) domain-containing protein